MFTNTIKKSHEFSRVYKRGRYYVGRLLILYMLKNSAADASGFNSLGVTASKKVGKSVRRNRLRRLVKENYRGLEPVLRRGAAIVFVVRPQAGLPSYDDVKADMAGLLKRAGMVQQ
jgi:ribonuclease P protein component